MDDSVLYGGDKGQDGISREINVSGGNAKGGSVIVNDCSGVDDRLLSDGFGSGEANGLLLYTAAPEKNMVSV